MGIRCNPDLSAGRTRLVVFAPHIGVISETFIRKHMVDLWPHGTAIIAFNASAPVGGRWQVPLDVAKLVWNEDKRSEIDGSAKAFQAAAYEFIVQLKADALMAEYLDHGLLLMPVCRAAGVRFFAHAHGYDVYRATQSPEIREAYLQYNEADGIIAVGSSAKARLVNIGIDPNKISVIPCGVTPVGQAVHQHKSTVTCVSVGRMVGKKGPILTLDAFRRAREQAPELRLIMVGDGPLRVAALQYVAAFGLEAVVTLAGELDHSRVLALLTESDIFIQHNVTDGVTGDQEGLPVAILEAMGAGLPVVTTWHASIQDAIEDRVTGYLVEPGDSGSMAIRIVELSRDRVKRFKMGSLAAEKIRSGFTWECERVRLLELMGLHRD